MDLSRNVNQIVDLDFAFATGNSANGDSVVDRRFCFCSLSMRSRNYACDMNNACI